MDQKIYGLILCFLLSSCSHLFYYPSDKTFYRPDKMKIKHEDFWLTTQDKVKIHGQHLKSEKKSKGLLIHFHGNAQNMTSHFLNVAWLTKYNYDVFVFDYRGYGKSEGVPSQQGTYLDSLAYFKYACEFVKKNKLNKLIVMGQSLGGVISLNALPDMECLNEVDLMVLDSTFSSYKWIAFDRLTTSWLSFLLSPLAFVLVSNEKGSMDSLDKIKTPLLVIHGEKDPVVPFKFGKEIYDKYQGKKWLWPIKSNGHTDVFWRKEVDYREKFIALLDSIENSN